MIEEPFQSRAVIWDKVHFGSGGQFGPQRCILFVTVPDVRAGDIIKVSGQLMFSNRAGQMIRDLFVGRFVSVEPVPPAPNIRNTVAPYPGYSYIQLPIGHNMSDETDGVYGDLFLQGMFVPTQDMGNCYVVVRAYTSSEAASPSNFLPVISPVLKSNQCELNVTRSRSLS